MLERGISGTISSLSSVDYYNRRQQDYRTVQSINRMLGEANVAMPERVEEIQKQLAKLPGSKFVEAYREMAGSFLAEELKNKREVIRITDLIGSKIDKIMKPVKSSHDLGAVEDAVSALRIMESNLLSVNPSISGENPAAIAQATGALGQALQYAMAKAEFYRHDDPAREGFQFAEETGPFTRARVESGLGKLETDPEAALAIARGGVPASEQRDVELQAQLGRVGMREYMAEVGDAQKAWNERAITRRGEWMEVYDATGLTDSEVQPLPASIIRVGDTGRVENTEELKSMFADRIYQLHRKFSDAAVKALSEADESGAVKNLFKQVRTAERSGDTAAIELAQSELADWWVLNMDKIRKLDVDKFFEIGVSKNQELARRKLMRRTIEDYGMFSKGMPQPTEAGAASYIAPGVAELMQAAKVE